MPSRDGAVEPVDQAVEQDRQQRPAVLFISQQRQSEQADRKSDQRRRIGRRAARGKPGARAIERRIHPSP